MITAFISHSSKQKKFANDLVNIIGKDYCKIDCVDFEPAFETLGEIYKCIDSSSIFVLLLSKDSIKSEWVKKEIYYAKDKYINRELERFFPYIIDPNLSLSDVPEWIRSEKAFNLKLFKSPIMLARDILQKQRELLWNKNPKIKLRESIFVGRNDKIEEFQNKLYSGVTHIKKALITSGRDGVGKKKFVTKCIIEELGYSEGFIPFKISINSNNSIEDFILQLNNITLKYTSDEINLTLSKDITSKIELAVELLNDIYALKGIIFVDDLMGCVRPERKLSKWFIDIIKNKKLDNKLGLFLFSRISPNAYIETSFPSIMHIQLLPLNTSDRRKLFFKYAQTYELTISNADADFFISKLLGSPEQICIAVDAIKKNGLLLAKHDIDDIIALGDKKVTSIMDRFTSDNISKNLLILLSKFEFISFDILRQIYENDYSQIEDRIVDFITYSIVEVFGPSDMYIRLDHSMSDYIKRNEIKLDDELSIRLEEVLSDQIIENDSLDLSSYLYNLRQKLLKGISNTAYLIPSIIITTIIDLYNQSKWDGVIEICDKVLTDCRNYYKEINDDIIYWLCLALCRKNDPRFYQIVTNIHGADEKFLRGFYFRIEQNYAGAEKLYTEALEINPQMNKARRELVTVKKKKKRYTDALELSEKNYKTNPTNTYHISAYYRCLIKKSKLTSQDIETLNSLKEDIQNSYSPKRESLLISMNIEYSAIVLRKEVREILKMIKDGLDKFPESYDIKRVANEYKYKQSIDNKLEYFPEDYQ